MVLKSTRAGNYPEWYQNVINEADMAEISSSPGCMVIMPWGYFFLERFRDFFYVYRGGYVAAAPTNKNTDSLHLFLSL